MVSGERAIIAGSERSAFPRGATIGAAEPTAIATVTVYLRRNPDAPPTAAFDTADAPRLTREEFADRLGASTGDIEALRAFGGQNGLTVVGVDRARRSVVLQGTVEALASAFGTEVYHCRGDDGSHYRGRRGPLTVPVAVAPLIVAAVGLDDRPQARSSLRRATQTGSGFTPIQVASLYRFPSGANATGQTVAVIELGGGYRQADLDQYFASLKVTTPTVATVAVDGGANTPGGAADAEVMLDIEVVGAMAPGVHIAVYFAPNTDQGFIDAISTAVHDTTNRPSVISISWGGPEDSWTAQSRSLMEQVFVDAAALGVTVTAASGDGGSSDGQSDGRQHVDFPASAPHALACGGTRLQATGATITSETVWNSGPAGGATGGGISAAFAVPDYQKAIVMPPSANAGSGPGRGVPDISGDADPATGFRIRVDGKDETVGGTSAVAPLWAALIALINQKAAKTLGFVHPRLYALGSGDALRDVTTGSNGAYTASAGWDPCTGLGSPNGAALLAALTAGPTPTPTPAPVPPNGSGVKRVVILIQENHTVDNYFVGLAPWGANVATGWPTSPNPPPSDQPHDRHAYFQWLTHQITGDHVQFDTAAVLPYYLYLAITGAFLENHCSGFGSNSTPNHMILVGGQSPTLRNPPRAKAQPVWDLPSLPGLAQDHGLTWRGYTGRSHYPLAFYQQLKGSPNLVGSAQFVADAKAGTLPQLCMMWHDSPLDEHPVANVTLGMNAIWQAVDAVVSAGQWNETVFLLTWDDWGGYDDHVATPAVEYTPDNVQLAYGPRIGLIAFGGRVRPGIDSRWCSHASITKTAIQLLGLPALGVPRVDTDAGLADLIDPALTVAPPPPFGTAIHLPAPPVPRPTPHPLPPHPSGTPKPVPPVILRNGSTMPAPNDAPLPHQPQPPTA